MQLATVELDLWIPPDVLRLGELVQDEARQAARQVGVQVSDRVRANLVAAGADVSHALLNSVDWEVTETAYEIVAEVFSLEAHALWIEEGRGPGPVPVQVIIEWMLDKGIAPQGDDTIEQAAHAIARHIAAHGFAGRHVFEMALEEAESYMIEAVDRLAARLGRRLN